MENKKDIFHNKQNSKNKRDIVDFLIVVLMLLCFYPYEFYSAYLNTQTNLSSTLYIVLFMSLVGLTLIFARKKPRIPPIFFVIVLLQCMGYVFCNLVKGNAFPTGPIMMSFLAVASVYFLSSTCGLEKFYSWYNKWILIMAFLGTLSLLLVWVGVMSMSVPFLDLSDEDIMYNYLITFSQSNYTDSFQYCGFFDEPGAMASWGMFALLFNKLFIKNSLLEKALIILLIATFSLGYYIQLFFYLLFFKIGKRNKARDYFRLVASIVFLATVYVVLDSFQGTKYDSIYQKTIARVAATLDDSKQTGIAVGDRKDLTHNAQVEFEKNPIWGTASKDQIDFGNNIYEPLAMYGIVGSFFIYLPFLYILVESIRKRDRELMKFFIILLLGFTHRPFHVNLLSFFIVYSFLALYYQQRIKQKFQLFKY